MKPPERGGNGNNRFDPTLPIFRVLVSGPSMAPTLHHGDALLVRRKTNAAPGAVVLARFRSRPELLVIKRVVRREGDGWWLAGDNEFASDASEKYGVADISAVAVARYWPRPSRL